MTGDRLPLPEVGRRWLLDKPLMATAGLLFGAAGVYSAVFGTLTDRFSVTTLAIVALVAFSLTAGLATRVAFEERRRRSSESPDQSVLRQRDTYCRVLSRLTHRYSVPTEDEKSTRYLIGLNGGGDHAEVTIVTRVTGQHTLIWKTFFFGVTGGRQLPSFDEVGFSWKPDAHDFLPLEPEEGDVRGMIVFNPQVAIGAATTWGYGYTWPTWDDLRAYGKDLCVVLIEPGVSALSVIFEFPPGAQDIDVDEPADRSTGQELGKVTATGELTRTWTISSPPAGRYELAIRMRPPVVQMGR